MKHFLFILFAFVSLDSASQVAISNDNSLPDTSAMLDVKSISKGLLIPRLTLAERSSIVSPAIGLLVFQTDVLPGFYFNSGAPISPNWSLVSTNATSWTTTGNASTASINFIGTTDNNALRFKVNNTQAGMIEPVGKNISIGIGSLSAITSGVDNIAIGWGALNHNTVGNNMVAIGDSALYNQTASNAYFNTAVGSKALFANTIGFENTAFGFAALTTNTIGTDNTAVGEGALRYNIDGHANTAVGLHALFNNVSGIYNSGMSAYTLLSNVSGNSNSALGFFADVTAGNFSNATAIGYNAKVDASDKVRIGNVNVNSIGGQVGWSSFSDGRFKILVEEDVPGLAFINRLRPVTYIVDLDGIIEQYKNGNNKSRELEMSSAVSQVEPARQSGFIAQEVEQAAMQSGFNFTGIDKPSNINALYGLRYGDFVVPIIKGMQEQQLIISKQNEVIEHLAGRLQKMEVLLEQISKGR